ncbi:hypothetical protein [Clostridium chrysemydis]|uniref:hypothetical protein n=1 Tax=Clostridium chrysemydis TaxID=2665504 RepID=UPI001883164F|nr:hypothetical protein [Clostridium chrysemydis]
MIITAITIPTPKRIKKKVLKLCTKERIGIYSCILTGIGIISLSDAEIKALPILGLLYCGFTFEVIERADPEVLEIMAKNMNENYYRYF